MRTIAVVPYGPDVRSENPASDSDTVSTVTRRDGSTYLVMVNERIGYVGVSEVVSTPAGTRWIDVYFAQGGEIETVTTRGELLTPRGIIRYLDFAGALQTA